MTPYATVTKFKADSSFKTSNKNQEEVFDEVKTNEKWKYVLGS